MRGGCSYQAAPTAALTKPGPGPAPSCSLSCLKLSLYCYNLVLVVLALAGLGVGLWLFQRPSLLPLLSDTEFPVAGGAAAISGAFLLAITVSFDGRVANHCTAQPKPKLERALLSSPMPIPPRPPKFLAILLLIARRSQTQHVILRRFLKNPRLVH